MDKVINNEIIANTNIIFNNKENNLYVSLFEITKKIICDTPIKL